MAKNHWGNEAMKEYTENEKSTITKLMRTTKNAVMQKKFQVILLHMNGHTNVKIAEITTLNVQTIGIYINTYKQLGTEGLVPKKPSGRPHLLSKEQEKLLLETISIKCPDEAGIGGFKNWTSKLACQWVLNEFGVQYSTNGMLDLLHRLGLSYTRPTYVLAKADAQKQKQFKEDFEVIKKTPRWRS